MKLSRKHLMLFLLFVSIHFFVMPNNIESLELVKDTEYYDWSEMENIEEEYSFSTIYLTEETEFIIYKNDGRLSYIDDNGNSLITNSGKKLPYIKNIPNGGELVMLVTKCAVNKENELLDVLIKVNNVIPFQSTGSVYLFFKTTIDVPSNQNIPSQADTYDLDVGNPLYMQLGADNANCDFTMTYYKSGTYDYSTDTGKLGNIRCVNGLYADIDIKPEAWRAGSFYSNFLHGYEGFVPNVGSSKIYYNKSMILVEDPKYRNMYLQEIDNGIAVAPNSEVNSRGIWYAGSAFMLTDDIPDSTFSITYGGIYCGLLFFFSSPYPYDVTNPLKNVTKEVITPEESFTYEISQYIPNNYYATVFNFKSIYSTSNEDSRLSYLAIKDSFSNLLKIEEDSIYITDETGTDVSAKFDIKLQDNELIVTSKEENFNESTFYNHTYTVHVPAVLKKGTKGVSSFDNVAVTAYKAGADEENLPSNKVTIDIIYKLIVNYLKEGTNETVAESKTTKYELNATYTTDYPDVSGLELVGIPDNASGTIIEDTIVNYYYREPIPIIIDNPKTGPDGSIIIASTIVLIMIIIYFYLYKYKNLYKYE